jgi:uncharacterized protein (UPF0332 family)
MTPEQKALLDKAQRSIDAAQSLTDQGFHDFAISRSYYAMFYIAEALLDNEGLSFSSHADVISAFGRYLAHAGKVPMEFHRYLIDAQAQRTLADYDTNSIASQEDVEEIIDRSQSLLAIALQNLTAD